MGILSQQLANNWVMVKGVTGPNSLDPLGQTAFTLKDEAAGVHHAGWSRPGGRPSNIIYRLFFDPDPNKVSQQARSGYFQFISVEWNGKRVDPEIIPGLAPRRFYKKKNVDAHGDVVMDVDVDSPVLLDFMSPKDARARFSDSLIPGPFYPFNAFLSMAPNFDTLGWHPMPYGSLFVPKNLWLGNSKPNWAAEKSLVPSLRTLITPMQIQSKDFEPYCLEGGEFSDSLLPANISQSFPQVMVAAFNAVYSQQAIAVDIQGVGSGLVITLDNGEVIAGQLTTVPPKPPATQVATRLQVWLIGQETFDHIEHEAALNVVDALAAWVETNAPTMGLPTPPTGRGSGGLRPPSPLVWFNPDQPLLKLVVYSVLTAVGRGLRKEKSLHPLSAVKATFSWRFDRVIERFSLDFEGVERFAGSAEWVTDAQKAFRWQISQNPASGENDLSVFSLGQSVWVDDAPARVPASG